MDGLTKRQVIGYGALGMAIMLLVGLLVYRAYEDDQKLQVIWTLELQRAQQAQAQAPIKPPPLVADPKK